MAYRTRDIEDTFLRMSPSTNLAKAFKLLDAAPQQRSTGAVICLAERLGSLGNDTLVIPAGYL